MSRRVKGIWMTADDVAVLQHAESQLAPTLPVDAEVLAFSWVASHHAYLVVYSHPTFPNTPPGETIPTFN